MKRKYDWQETCHDSAEEDARDSKEVADGARILAVDDGVCCHAVVITPSEADEALADYSEGYAGISGEEVEVSWALYGPDGIEQSGSRTFVTH